MCDECNQTRRDRRVRLPAGLRSIFDAIRSIFDADDTDAVLLIDASNAFDSLNRAAALYNISVLCPSIVTYAINTSALRHARLFVMGGEELLSAEGTTQGDPVAMSLYAVSLQPLIAQLQTSSSTKQCWFADGEWYSGKCDAMMERTVFERTCVRVFPER